jgi:hypothetical protein
MSRTCIGRPAFGIFSVCVAWAAMSLPAPLNAADNQAVIVSHPQMSRAPAVETDPYATLRQKNVEYGCKRIWRCDDQVCEWRRGCWGIYGYVEAPYYSLPLAKRQWQSQGWPTSSR